MGGGKYEKKMKMGDRRVGGIGFYVDEEFDLKYICFRKCFVRIVLLIKIFKDLVIF